MQFRNNPYLPNKKLSEIPRGRGALKVKILEATYEAKLEFPGGTGRGGAKQKTFCKGSMEIFWSSLKLILKALLTQACSIDTLHQFIMGIIGMEIKPVPKLIQQVSIIYSPLTVIR